jgi:uncharacterized membrane protein
MSFVKEIASTYWKRIKKELPVNRVIALLTVFVFVPGATSVTAWLAVHFPGLPQFDPTVVAGWGALGAAAALTAFYKWMDGWIKDKVVPKTVLEQKVVQEDVTKKTSSASRTRK